MQEVSDERYREADKILLVMDNLNTHVISSFYEAFEPAEARRLVAKLEIHYTPKQGSWLNMAEIELSHLFRQCLNRRLADISEVKKETDVWVEERNKCHAVVNWQFTSADARVKLKRLYPIIQQDKINETL